MAAERAEVTRRVVPSQIRGTVGSGSVAVVGVVLLVTLVGSLVMAIRTEPPITVAPPLTTPPFATSGDPAARAGVGASRIASTPMPARPLPPPIQGVVASAGPSDWTSLEPDLWMLATWTIPYEVGPQN